MKPFSHPSVFLVLCMTNGAFAAQTGHSITIYSSAQPGAIPAEIYRHGAQAGYAVPGYALVRHDREIALASGRNEVRFTDVAGLIDPTTVSFQSLTDPRGARVIEQNFQFDLVSTEKLMRKFVDREISVEQTREAKVETFNGTLLSTQGSIVLRQADGMVRSIPHNSGVVLPNLPGGLITRPTLLWEVAAQKAGAHNVRVSYQTTGVTWWADYNLTYTEGADANSCKVDVGAWVSILNQSGAGYPEAKIKLIAGDVHRAPQPQATGGLRASMEMKREDLAEAGFQEKSFFEYHLYTLGRPSTLPDNSTKQIELFPSVSSVPCDKTLVCYG
ncbi:MAG: hypothetical protein EXR36_01620 [Betaproteobacteria bacterium]|nr:hypothetical protein [Betaproteobacteria bacterium]